MSNSWSSISVFVLNSDDYNVKNKEDKEYIVVDCDEVSFMLGITVKWSLNGIELIIFGSFSRLLFLSRLRSWNSLESSDVTCFYTVVFDKLSTCAIDWNCFCLGATCVIHGMIIGEYDTSRSGVSFVHVTDWYPLELSVNDIFVSFLNSISFLLFTAWSMIWSSLKIKLWVYCSRYHQPVIKNYSCSWWCKNKYKYKWYYRHV